MFKKFYSLVILMSLMFIAQIALAQNPSGRDRGELIRFFELIELIENNPERNFNCSTNQRGDITCRTPRDSVTRSIDHFDRLTYRYNYDATFICSAPSLQVDVECQDGARNYFRRTSNFSDTVSYRYNDVMSITCNRGFAIPDCY